MSGGNEHARTPQAIAVRSLARVVGTFACLALTPVASAAAAELVVDPERPAPGENVTVILSGVSGEGSQALVVTRFPGSRVERSTEHEGELEGQGVRWVVAFEEPGLFRVQAGTESVNLMVGYDSSPAGGWFILALALASLGGLTAWGLMATAPGTSDTSDSLESER